MVSERTGLSHQETVEFLLDKTITSLKSVESGRDVAALVKSALDMSKELESITGGKKSKSAAQSKIDEVNARRQKRSKTA